MQKFGFVQMLYTSTRQVWVRGNSHSLGWAYAHIMSSNDVFDIEYSSSDFWWRSDQNNQRFTLGTPSESDTPVIQELLRISGLSL